MVRRNHVPAYRLHEQSGTLTTRREYARVIGEWEARGRRLEQAAPTDLTVAELLVRFLNHARTYYRDPESGEPTEEYDEFERTTITLTDTSLISRQGSSARPTSKSSGSA